MFEAFRGQLESDTKNCDIAEILLWSYDMMIVLVQKDQ